MYNEGIHVQKGQLSGWTAVCAGGDKTEENMMKQDRVSAEKYDKCEGTFVM